MFKDEKIDFKGMPFLFEHQNIILSYLHPENPYRALIVLYELGSGKTYAACCLSQLYLVEGFKVLYLSNSVAAVNNFINEYNEMIMDLRQKSYKKCIDSMTFTKYYKRSNKIEYGLIIVDEVHNLREMGLRYSIVKQKLDSAVNSKILLMTATPIVDNVKEMEGIKKIAGCENPKILKNIKTVTNKINVEYVGTNVFGETLFLSKMKGEQLEEYNNCGNKDVFTRARQSTLSCCNVWNSEKPLEMQSCKINSLLKVLQKEPTVIFCFYIGRGIDILTEILKYKGYKNYNENTDNSKTYAVITGNMLSNQTNEIISKFNSIANIDGLIISILIGSSVMKESITLNRVRALHILTPFWNYSQIKQSIGRVVRHNSHLGLSEPTLKIYLHASYVNDPNDCEDSVDIKMWYISKNKKELINNELENNIKYSTLLNKDVFTYPEPDNKLIFRIENEIWDLTNCFDHNKFKISWCNVYEEKAVKYDLINKTVYNTNISSKFTIRKPVPGGYTIWRSAVDNRLRLSYINEKLGKFSKRGKLLINVKTKLIEKELKVNNLKEYLLSCLRYFDKQIEYDL